MQLQSTVTFPDLAWTTATFCGLCPNHSSMSTQKGIISSKGGALWSSKGNRATACQKLNKGYKMHCQWISMIQKCSLQLVGTAGHWHICYTNPCMYSYHIHLFGSQPWIEAGSHLEAGGQWSYSIYKPGIDLRWGHFDSWLVWAQRETWWQSVTTWSSWHLFQVEDCEQHGKQNK